jgi:hypothetical protein
MSYNIEYNYIYLLQLREFVNAKQFIYKIGRTSKENNKRFHQYPKGSVLLCQIICSNCITIEKNLIQIFKEKFIHSPDIGNEYFEGNYIDMIKIIYEKCIDSLSMNCEIIYKQEIKESDKSENKEGDKNKKTKSNNITKENTDSKEINTDSKEENKIYVKQIYEYNTKFKSNNQCMICNKKFKYNYLLIRHNSNKIKCNITNTNINIITNNNKKSITKIDTLTIIKLQNKYSNLNSKLNKKNKEILINNKCNFCSNELSNYSNLKMHIKNNCNIKKQLLLEINALKIKLNKK